MNSIKFMIFLGSSVALFTILLNTDVFYLGLSDGNTWIIIALSASCFVAGLIVTCLVGRYVKEHIIQTLGATMAALGSIILIYNIDIHIAFKICIALAAALIGGFIAHYFKRYIVITTTSVVGSCMFFYGLMQFSGNVFASNDKNYHFYENWVFWAYSVGALVMAIAGWFVQLKVVGFEELEEGDFRR